MLRGYPHGCVSLLLRTDTCRIPDFFLLRKEKMDEEIYQPPELVELGDAREVTLGAADDDTADMNTAKYY
ncbi:hypothetical protein GCM10022630_33190 [Thermobifida alba]